MWFIIVFSITDVLISLISHLYFTHYISYLIFHGYINIYIESALNRCLLDAFIEGGVSSCKLNERFPKTWCRVCSTFQLLSRLDDGLLITRNLVIFSCHLFCSALFRIARAASYFYSFLVFTASGLQDAFKTRAFKTFRCLMI